MYQLFCSLNTMFYKHINILFIYTPEIFIYQLFWFPKIMFYEHITFCLHIYTYYLPTYLKFSYINCFDF